MILAKHLGFYPSLSRSVAIYCTWSPSGVASDMVLKQMAAYRDVGFDVVVVSNSPVLDMRLREEASWVIHRENQGYDFGAWKDAIPFIWSVYGEPDEVLLVNDSVLGPARSLQPVFAALRSRGEGMYGLTDCLLYMHHIQSYLTLFRGSAAVRSMVEFLEQMPEATTKGMAIHQGELMLSYWMTNAGHQVGAMYGYETTLQRLYRSEDGLDWLNAIRPPSRRDKDSPWAWTRRAAIRRTERMPMNPCHHLWLPLLRIGFPFVKTELVRKNPGRVPGVEHLDHWWPKDGPVSIDEVRDHLRGFET